MDNLICPKCGHHISDHSLSGCMVVNCLCCTGSSDILRYAVLGEFAKKVGEKFAELVFPDRND